MSKFKDKKPVRINVLLDEDVRKKYKKHCIDNDYVLSDRIRELIERDLKDEIKYENQITVCFNKKNNKYSLRKEGYLFWTGLGSDSWVEENESKI